MLDRLLTDEPWQLCKTITTVSIVALGALQVVLVGVLDNQFFRRTEILPLLVVLLIPVSVYCWFRARQENDEVQTD